ncbi:thioredoxin family protein [Thermofilum pendens]|uniref:Thioredoxin-like fold domain-containing protein n=1 Tax=Thermofilum pendens (strain DSM 2475 / Hrk 5) TaxID=368408 RepID=A1RY71_THEPD|nr:arsenic metallochaperone ArsD family protein [Thermofilum pendens]ABL78151.1 hypothetical protein Tpen_0749 [Thermofilum pendens Hrk 5]
MPREVLLFICRDEASKSLINAFNSELSELPKPERPKLKVKLFKLKDPSNFKSYLEQLEELYGGVYTREVKEYGIQSLPAVVVDGEKVLEGRYPSREEIRRILGLPPRPAPREERPAPIIAPEVKAPAVAAPPPERREPPKPTRVPEPIEIPVELEEPELEEHKPPPVPEEKPREQPPREAPRPVQQAPRLPPPPPAPKPEAVPARPPVAQPPRREPAQQVPAPPKPVATEDLRGTCFTCLFFDKERSRCKLLHMTVQDPYNPPCGRRRPR